VEALRPSATTRHQEGDRLPLIENMACSRSVNTEARAGKGRGGLKKISGHHRNDPTPSRTSEPVSWQSELWLTFITTTRIKGPSKISYEKKKKLPQVTEVVSRLAALSAEKKRRDSPERPGIVAEKGSWQKKRGKKVPSWKESPALHETILLIGRDSGKNPGAYKGKKRL